MTAIENEIRPTPDTPEPLLITTFEDQLKERFEAERLSALASDYLENSPFGNIKERLAGKETVIGVIAGNDPQFADIAKGIETPVFAHRFKRSLSEVYSEYEPTDERSIFLVSFDVKDPDHPRPAGAMRMIYGDTDLSLKSTKDLVADSEENPWLQEVSGMLFAANEPYDAQTAWNRLLAREGVNLVASETADVATLAVDPAYADKNGAMDAHSMLLYHSCLRFNLGNGIKNLVSIQDVKPLDNLQQFGEPFSLFNDIKPHPYGGPFDTLPAYAVLYDGMQRIRKCALGSSIGEVFIDGKHLENAVLLQELDPTRYGDASVADLIPPAV